MHNDPVQTFWNSVFAQAQEKVRKRNEEQGPHLKFERIPNGFRVCRESPFLVVEQWLDDNQIYGRSEANDKSGRQIPTVFVPLAITSEHEASLPPDPMRKDVALTAGDVACGVLGFF
jgi:hypothetical protein